MICFFDEGESTLKVLYLRDGAETQQQMEALLFFSLVNLSKVIVDHDVTMVNIAAAIKHTAECSLQDEDIDAEDEDVDAEDEDVVVVEEGGVGQDAHADLAVNTNRIEETAQKPKGRGRRKAESPPPPPPEGHRRGPARQSKSNKDVVVAVPSELVVVESDKFTPVKPKRKYTKRRTVKPEKKTGMCFKYVSKQHVDCKTDKEVAPKLSAPKGKRNPGKSSDLTSKFLANFQSYLFNNMQ